MKFRHALQNIRNGIEFIYIKQYILHTRNRYYIQTLQLHIGIINGACSLVVSVLVPTLAEGLHFRKALAPVAGVVVTDLQLLVFLCTSGGDDSLIPFVGGVVVYV